MQSEPGVLRRLIRRVPQILLLWLVVFAPVAWWILRFVEPTYESFSILRVEPTTNKISGPLQEDFTESRSAGPYLRTQLNLITSGRVLKPVVTEPEIVNVPVIAGSKDPEAELRKKLNVEIIEDAYMIRIALELPNPEHAATIIDAVVKTYLDYNKDFKRANNALLTSDLKGHLKLLEAEITANKEKLKALYLRSTVNVSKPNLTPKNDGDSTQPTFVSYTEEHVQRIIEQMVKTELELIEARATLEVTQASNRANDESPERLKVATGTSKSAEAIDELKIRVGALTKTKEAQAKLYERLRIEKKTGNNDTFEATYLNYEVSRLLNRRDQVTANLAQLDFESNQNFFHVHLVDPASHPKTPTNSLKWVKFMAAAPVGILFTLLGLFLLVEIKAGRSTARFSNGRLNSEAGDGPDGEYVGFKPGASRPVQSDGRR